MILCGKCKEPRPVFRVGASRTLKCVQCIAAHGSRKDRVALLLNAWDRFAALRPPPKVDYPLYMIFEAKQGGNSQLLLLPDLVRRELKIEAELAYHSKEGMQPVVLGLFTPGRRPLYIVKGHEPSTQEEG
jgi:hypothetical protein